MNKSEEHKGKGRPRGFDRETALDTALNIDERLKTARMRAHNFCHAISRLRTSDINGRFKILRELLPYAFADLFVTQLFFCDYGWNTPIL